MHPTPRRTLLGAAATLAALPTVRPAAAQPGPCLPFDVPPTTILVAGTGLQFPVAGATWLKVNGDLRQSAGLRGMTIPITEQISHRPTAFELQPGDLIPSAASQNVGPVLSGNVMQGHLDSLPAIHVRTVAA
jgi:2-keto-4-pentenoate hydratase/2-oxohepta-3-ene-1,7-dioic acid hydratase in catechol pathway